MKTKKGSKFLRFFIPILDVLKELGGSGTPTEVTDAVIERLNITEEEQEKTIKSGASRIRNQIAWARFYLVKSDFIDSSQRGIWSLTEKGLSVNINEKDVYKCFNDVRKNTIKQSEKNTKLINELDNNLNEETEDEYSFNYKTELKTILQNLSPSGFERICQRLLRESGFQQVVVTGRVGDGGIDGHGILQINPVVSFNVLFQCKRYQGSVTASQVRDFRGAMMGRTDKGIILTTGSFTLEAKKEARRDGVPPIELVDGDKLVEMFELLELGLIPRKIYDIDSRFFADFQQ
ncbi:restriction endonuclease [Candidatus Magnetomorum sp. HK-1]|nr:restriction endonuclease [Candidatus Magnetomorum sp. HK-1]